MKECIGLLLEDFRMLNPEVTANEVTINVVVDKILNGLYNEHIHYTC